MFSRLASIVAIALSVSQVNASLTKRFTCPSGHVTGNAACCALFPVVDLLQSQLFDGGECGEQAHSSLRLAFHDAMGFSLHGGKGGGADGSILTFHEVETTFPVNDGIDDVIAAQLPVFAQTNLSSGDFLHLAAAVGTGNCPGAPRLQFKFGRPTPIAAASDHTIPEPTDNVTTILNRFADVGFSPREAVALLSGHSIADAHSIDIPGTGFDSTGGLFDTQIFLEVLLKGTMFPNGNSSNKPAEVLAPFTGEMRLQSDFAISRDPRTACFWQAMVNDQRRMQTEFKAAMAKLQTLGQPRNLIDCSDVIPIPADFAGPIKYPPGLSMAQIEQACLSLPFPSISTVAAPTTTSLPIPGS